VSRPGNDLVALAIGQAVQRYVLDGLATAEFQVEFLPALPEVTAVEAHAVGELDTGIAVTMADRGVRYFLVRVSEFDHPPVSRDVE
jgi:hypothetical protein